MQACSSSYNPNTAPAPRIVPEIFRLLGRSEEILNSAALKRNLILWLAFLRGMRYNAIHIRGKAMKETSNVNEHFREYPDGARIYAD